MDVKEWKEDNEHVALEKNRADLFKRSISESPNFEGSRETLTGSNINIASSSSRSKFGSTFSIVKHKKVDLTSFDAERIEDKTPERHKSGPSIDVPTENVLKKAASINLDQSFSGGKSKLKVEPLITQSVKPLDVSECDTFEGRAFLKWVTHTLANDDYFKMQLTEQDLKFIGRQIGTLLVSAKVVKEMDDKNHNEENECILFRDDIMYQWKKSDKQSCNAGTPGKIEFKLPNIQNGENEQKHGAKYTEAEVQQLLMGLKREHKDNLELLQKDHDEALFKQRGEQATSVEYYVEKIQNLEEELQSLRPKSKKNSIIGT